MDFCSAIEEIQHSFKRIQNFSSIAGNPIHINLHGTSTSQGAVVFSFSFIRSNKVVV